MQYPAFFPANPHGQRPAAYRLVTLVTDVRPGRSASQTRGSLSGGRTPGARRRSRNARGSRIAARLKAARQAESGAIEPFDFKSHDLRRTAASMMASGGIPRLTISKILNHAESGVTDVYDRHGYDPEKRAALDWWALKLQAILENKDAGKVLAFARA